MSISITGETHGCIKESQVVYEGININFMNKDGLYSACIPKPSIEEYIGSANTESVDSCEFKPAIETTDAKIKINLDGKEAWIDIPDNLICENPNPDKTGRTARPYNNNACDVRDRYGNFVKEACDVRYCIWTDETTTGGGCERAKTNPAKCEPKSDEEIQVPCGNPCATGGLSGAAADKQCDSTLFGGECDEGIGANICICPKDYICDGSFCRRSATDRCGQKMAGDPCGSDSDGQSAVCNGKGECVACGRENGGFCCESDAEEYKCLGDLSCDPATNHCIPAISEEGIKCGDKQDNDRDGKTDCDDPDCASYSNCVNILTEICGNGADDDKDGFKDCLDMDCFESCCGNGVCDSPEYADYIQMLSRPPDIGGFSKCKMDCDQHCLEAQQNNDQMKEAKAARLNPDFRYMYQQFYTCALCWKNLPDALRIIVTMKDGSSVNLPFNGNKEEFDKYQANTDYRLVEIKAVLPSDKYCRSLPQLPATCWDCKTMNGYSYGGSYKDVNLIVHKD